MDFQYLGKKIAEPTRSLDTFSAPDNVTYVKFETDELTSFCPVTGQPDFSTAIIEYEPDKLCIESKSLKLYIWSFRNEAIFAEGLASRIANDVFKAIQPKWTKITIRQNIRGGLQLTTTAEKKKDTE